MIRTWQVVCSQGSAEDQMALLGASSVTVQLVRDALCWRMNEHSDASCWCSSKRIVGEIVPQLRNFWIEPQLQAATRFEPQL